MSDLLDMAYINSLPQPLMAQKYGSTGDDWLWPVEVIDVQTGCMRIDVCGQSDRCHIGDVKRFKDDAGVWHSSDDFYADSERAVTTKNKE